MKRNIDVFREKFQFWIKVCWFSVAVEFITLMLGFNKLLYVAVLIWAIGILMGVRYIVLTEREIRKGVQK